MRADGLREDKYKLAFIQVTFWMTNLAFGSFVMKILMITMTSCLKIQSIHVI